MERKVDYQIVSSVNEGILEIILKGEVTEGGVEKLQNKVVDIIEAKGAKNVLVDSRDIKGYKSFLETYVAIKRPLSTRVKVNTAVVEHIDNELISSFLEASARNSSLSLKWFTDIDAARAWLKSKQSK